MRIQGFQIENYRNIRLAKCDDVPDFMVICGGNGSGKSALLEALMTVKEQFSAYSYGYFQTKERFVSANADHTRISMNIKFSKDERAFVQERFKQDCNEEEIFVIEILKNGNAIPIHISTGANLLLGYYSREINSPGFFDYINAHRLMPVSNLTSWNVASLSEQEVKQTLSQPENKFHLTKQYLASIKMKDIQDFQSAIRAGNTHSFDSLQEIRDIFDNFFAPMRFMDVYLHESPFRFAVDTPAGEIDIDDLSSGEKEILNIIVRFHQLKPRHAVILFDEADAHLHPDLERRYLQLLRKLSQGNQLILTTHSPEMMIASGTDSLYTMLKIPLNEGDNQLVRVTTNESLHNTLTELMGSRGIISINQRIIFIEGEDSSADREIYEAFYPPSQFNVSFVPAGDSRTVRKVAEQVNILLSNSTGFQEYYSIVDGDIERAEPGPAIAGRLFRLPVYHIENLLLDEEAIFLVFQDMFKSKCPYQNVSEVLEDLKKLVLSDIHVNPYTKAVLDAKLAHYAKQSYDAVFQGKSISPLIQPVTFDDVKTEAQNILTTAIHDGTWKEKSKGRDLLKALSAKYTLKYEHLRNLIISKIELPPKPLDEIMKQIL
jgi:AAA15 family ATPase/GTPase